MAFTKATDMQDIDLSKDEKTGTATVDGSYSGSDVGFDDKATKRLLRKIDIVLIPFLSGLYL
jgi:hypothetical protein